MSLLRFLVFGIMSVILLPSNMAAEWQWSVKIPGIVSNETNDHPQAFLWIPSDCIQVKGVMIGTHNMTEETLFENALFREKMSEIDLALIWITPGWDQKWDITAGSQKAFEQMLDDFASVSGYNELKYAPIVPFGHSAMATYPWNFAAWNPDRTLAIISLHGDAPRTNLTGYGRDNMEWGKRTIDGIPGLMIEGEYEWWEDRVNPVFAKKYRVIRYDLRGYGISSSQTEDYQFTHAEDLVTLMDSLHIKKAHIVGLSLGGFITADMLAYFPDRMLSAFLASGNIRKSKGPSEPMTPEEARVRDKEIAALKEKGVDVMKKEWFEGLMKSGGSQRERMRESLWQMIDEWDAWQPLHKEVRVVAGLDAIEKLKKNHPDVPALIVEGHSSGNRFSKEPPILQYLPNGKLKVIDDCGHMLNMERPEEFNAALEEFLKSVQ